MALINGTENGDSLAGGTDDDVMFGGAGDDTVRSSAGDDLIEGGEGSDTYVLSLGRGSFVVTSPTDGELVIHSAPGGPGGNFGTDTVTGVEFFRIVASSGTLTVPVVEMLARFNFGYSDAPTEGNDKLLGGYGADGLNGLGGDDTIEGSAGDDWLAGGVGADVFVFHAWEGANDRIEDFQVGVDRIQVHTAYGYQPWATEGTVDGEQGTWVTWGWDNDAVFLAGVTGVGIDALLL